VFPELAKETIVSIEGLKEFDHINNSIYLNRVSLIKHTFKYKNLLKVAFYERIGIFEGG